MAGESVTTQWGDRELVLAFKDGRSDAYDEVYRRYQPRVRRVCAQLIGNPADTDEAVQETFLRAYRALPRFNGRYQLGAWLARIAANVCVDQLRSRSRAQLVALPAFDSELMSEPGPESVVANQNPRVEKAIQELQPLHARALQMRALDEMSHQEMANHLAMSPSQVKALLHRARTSFKKAWEKAEGWLLAPLGGSKLWNDRSAPTSSTLVGAGPTMGPYMVEKVATSAMIVAVALAGMPALPSTSPQPTPQPAPTLAARTPFGTPTAGDGHGKRDGVEDGGQAEVEAGTKDVPELLSRSISGSARVPQGDSGSRSDPSGQDPLGPVTNQADELARELQQKLHDALPPPN
jgi:RNA polymerase sigma-70 factor (ECF subfamily)